MYCKNCGKEITSDARFCTNCGTESGKGSSFCADCGNPAVAGAAFCVICGAPQGQPNMNESIPHASAPAVCAHCGAPLTEGAAFCTSCGAPASANTFSSPVCARCGQPITPGTAFCTACGAPIGAPAEPTYDRSECKSRMLCGFMGIFLGCYGVHHFIMGETGKGVRNIILTGCSLFSCGVTGIIATIFGIVDGIKIFNGTIKTDAHGRPLV